MSSDTTNTDTERKHFLADCPNCPLKEATCVPSQIPQGAKTAFVSRSPGSYDARVGAPFANPRGSKAVLDHLLKRHNVDRDKVVLTNVVLCQSDDPPTAAIKACKERLEYEIKDCDLVIAGGAEAVDALTKYRTVTRSRGFSINRTNRISNKPQRVIVTNNPAAVVRNSDLYPDMVKDFKRAFDPPPPPIYPKVTIVENVDDINKILRLWLETEFTILANDLEWAGTKIACAGFSQSPERAAVLAGTGLYERATRQLLRDFYQRSDIEFVWHNGQSDTQILRRNNIRGRVDRDTFIMSYDLDERPGYHKLEYLLSEHFGWPDYEPESVRHFKKTGEFLEPKRKSMLELYKYNGLDTAGTLQLHTKFANDPDLDPVHVNRLLEASSTYLEVELNGFNYDDERACNINEEEVYYMLWEMESELREIAEHPLLNPRSHKQVSAIYYNEWGLKHALRDSGKKKFKTSVGKEVREEIKGGRYYCKPQFKDKLVSFNEQYERYQKVTKLQSSFIEGLVKRVQKDGKLYCHFNVCGTATGRPSSSDPNFQNIAREGFETIPGIRTLFVPSPGHQIVSCDLSQAELRTCAELSGDRGLLSIYRDSKRSLHKERAAKFYGENYTKDEYVKAKNINFGVTYLQSAASFAQMYHMPEKEAQAYIDSWWRDFPQLREWTKEVGERARKEGVVRTPFGHRRRFHLITDENIGDIKREAVNTTPQNVAAWLTIYALIDVVRAGVRAVATVHDNIVADVPVGESYEVAAFMKETMEKQAKEQLGWDLPFLADVSIGPSWGELEEVDLQNAKFAVV